MIQFLPIVLLAFAGLPGLESGSVKTGPTNSTAVVGHTSNVTLSCLMQDLRIGENVLWKKVFPTPVATLIINQLSQNESKYGVTLNGATGQFDLHILNIETADHGEYRCEASDSADAWLNVGVPMQNMSLYWPGMSEKIVENEAANLTCHSAISRPPATLRLYKGTHDVTYLATAYHGDVDENGFGESFLHLEQTLTRNDKDLEFRCEADIFDQRNLMNATLTVDIEMRNGADALGANCLATSIAMVILSIFVTKS